jgi:molybdate transport system substrate-binding protein
MADPNQADIREARLIPLRLWLRTMCATGVAPLALAVLLTVGSPAAADDIAVMSSGAINAVIGELGPRFEQTSGHKPVMTYGIGTALKQRIVAGEAFDAALLVGSVDDLVQQGKIIAGTPTVLGHTGYGVAVRKGAPKPDIGTTAALKRALLEAKSVAFTQGGGSGAYFLQLIERLGIAEAMKAKLVPSADSAGAVASGEAEMTINDLAPIARTAGIDLVGPLPAELQSYSTFVGGVGTAARNADAARGFLAFLTLPASNAVWKAKGVEPGPPPK